MTPEEILKALNDESISNAHGFYQVSTEASTLIRLFVHTELVQALHIVARHFRAKIKCVAPCPRLQEAPGTCRWCMEKEYLAQNLEREADELSARGERSAPCICGAPHPDPNAIREIWLERGETCRSELICILQSGHPGAHRAEDRLGGVHAWGGQS